MLNDAWSAFHEKNKRLTHAADLHRRRPQSVDTASVEADDVKMSRHRMPEGKELTLCTKLSLELYRDCLAIDGSCTLE